LTHSLSTAESEQAVSCPGNAWWVSAHELNGGKTAAAGLWAELQALQPREGSNEYVVCLFTFSNVSNAGTLSYEMKQSSQLNKLYYKTLWEKATCFSHLIDHQAYIQEVTRE
jgi:hypothetical protein